MKKLIAYCGLDCEKCDARKATLNNDNALREKVARLWSEMNGVEITPEMINCEGCRADGVKTPFCDSLCRIRQCALGKTYETCGDCPSMSDCRTVGAVISNNAEASDNLKNSKMNNLSLHVPKYCELNYRRKLLSDPETMSYNAGYELGEGYDNETGCIDFPESDWEDWREYWIGQPDRFYAYIVKPDGEFIGEVNLYKGAGKTYNMGIVIEAGHRGHGYAEAGMKLLLKQAFEVMGADAVVNDFEDTRLSAVRLHLKAGFEAAEKHDGITVYKITAQKYKN